MLVSLALSHWLIYNTIWKGLSLANVFLFAFLLEKVPENKLFFWDVYIYIGRKIERETEGDALSILGIVSDYLGTF